MNRLALSVLALTLLVSNVFAKNSDADLKSRLTGADYVVVGEVVKVEKANLPGSNGVSEHNPDWYIAHIKVIKMLKFFTVPATTNSSIIHNVYFPASKDVAWAKSPKFKKGQKGIFILSWTDMHATSPSNMITRVLTASDQLDFQPTNQLNKINGLLVK